MTLNKNVLAILSALLFLAAACGESIAPIQSLSEDERPAKAVTAEVGLVVEEVEVVVVTEEAPPAAITTDQAAVTAVNPQAESRIRPAAPSLGGGPKGVADAVSAEVRATKRAAQAAAAAESRAKLAKNGRPLLDDEPAYSYEPIWQTDFSLHTVPYDEIFSGGVPRDGIPPLDNPQFVSVAEADAWLEAVEPVFVVTLNEETRAYPLQILTWHEIVNDTVGGRPVVVTFCPLCNSAVTFERTVNGMVYDFGVSGKLRHSDLIMWDRQTESWWQQLTGEAIVGELVGEQLTFIPTRLVSWGDFKETFPQAEVLSQETGHHRPYGQNPYAGYDSDPAPFLFAGEPDSRLAAMDRVVAVNLGGEFVAYPYQVLAEQNVIADTVGGQAVVVFWTAGTTSALDGAAIAGSRDVGSAAVYSPLVDGQALTFAWDGNSFVDAQTDSQWSIFGQATAGPLAGSQLEPVIHANHFWFAYAAFHAVRLYGGE